MLSRLSAWFDSLKEPQRFFVFMMLVFGWYLPFTVIVFLDSTFTGLFILKFLLAVFGFCQIFFFLMFALYRATRK
jgi:hypothetical protein